MTKTSRDGAETVLAVDELNVEVEDIEVVPEPDRPNDVPVEVDVVEPFGKENNLYLFPAGGDADEAIVATVEGRTRVGADDRVGMRILEEHIHLFDRQGGTALRNAVVEEADLSPVVERSANT